MRRLFAAAAKRWHRNPSLIRLEAEVRAFADSLPKGSRVLDAGAGDCRYRQLFASHRYETADFAQVVSKEYGKIDHICDLSAIPVENNRFDAIICTQVLAHVPQPMQVIAEFARILKPGAPILVSCPLFFQENEKPYDFYRYTQFGLRYLLEKNGLYVRRLDWLEGYYATFAYQLSVAAMSLPATGKEYGGGVLGIISCCVATCVRVVAAAGCQFFAWCESRQKIISAGQCINYIAIAERLDAS